MKENIVISVVGFSLFLYVVCGNIRYDRCGIWDVQPQNNELVHKLYDLYEKHQHAELRQIQFWEAPVKPGKTIQLLVCPSGQDEFVNFLVETGIHAVLKKANIQNDLDELFEEREIKRELSQLDYDENDYNTYEDIMKQLEVLQAECPAGFSCSVETIGRSWEGRDLKLFTLVKEGENRKGVWIDSLIHAREWIAGATTMGILTKLIRSYDHDLEAAYLLDNYDWFFTPVMNPDGYSYTWTDDRFWRKNRSPVSNSTCQGTDLNRNYNYLWYGPDGASNDPCSLTFRGESPASELETASVQREGQRLSDRLVLWLSFHAYGKVYLFPFGHLTNGSCSRADDYADLKQVGNAAVKAITETFNEVEWQAGDGCDRNFVTSGITQDWAKGTGIVKYSYSPELRGEGFEISPSVIPASIAENWNGLIALINEIEKVENV